VPSHDGLLSTRCLGVTRERRTSVWVNLYRHQQDTKMIIFQWWTMGNSVESEQPISLL
jgi:hypothetical protein